MKHLHIYLPSDEISDTEDEPPDEISNIKDIIDPSKKETEKEMTRKTATSALRPRNFNEFIGNKEVVSRLTIALGSAKKRKEVPGHILLFGPAGLGKTTLSKIVATEMGCNFKTITGGTVTSQKDILRILHEIGYKQKYEGVNTILFIDEVHKLGNKECPEELWYSIFEEFEFYHDLTGSEISGSGVVTSDMIWLDPFTIIGATTSMGTLTKPLRERFQIGCSLTSYSPEEIAKIIKGYCKRAEIRIDDKAAARLSKSARSNPRVSINLSRACRDRMVYQDKEIIDIKIVLEELEAEGIDELGLTKQDYKILKILAENEKGMGIKNLAGTADVDSSSLENAIEPFLKQLYFIKTTHRRFITEQGIQRLKDLNLIK